MSTTILIGRQKDQGLVCFPCILRRESARFVCSHRAITRPQDDAAWRPLIACLDTVGSSQPSRMSSIIVESFWPMLPQVVFSGRSHDRPPCLILAYLPETLPSTHHKRSSAAPVASSACLRAKQAASGIVASYRHLGKCNPVRGTNDYVPFHDCTDSPCYTFPFARRSNINRDTASSRSRQLPRTMPRVSVSRR